MPAFSGLVLGQYWEGRGVKAIEFGSGVLGAEPPVYDDAGCVALGFISSDLASARDEFNLSHVQPTCVFGRVVNLQALHDVSRLAAGKVS